MELLFGKVEKGEVKEQVKPERMAKGIRNGVLKYDPRKSKTQ